MKTNLLLIFWACIMLSGCNSCNNTQQQTTTLEEKDPYINNSLSTGATPYRCLGIYGDESTISITTSSDCDVVAIIKSGQEMVANSYIERGNTYTFHLPNGSYQVFFYGGNGWNPNKKMKNGQVGGFVENESFSKDDPVFLEYQALTYELILQQNGNFNAKNSNANEMF